jgi:hypothetical protein
MEHGDSSRGSRMSTSGGGDGAPSRRRRLNPGIASSLGYGQGQNAVAWGIPTPLQEAWEELATMKAVVTSLEEEVVLARSQRTESDRRCVGECFTVSLFCFFRDLMPNAHLLFWAELLVEVESLCDAAHVLADFVRAPTGHREERRTSADSNDDRAWRLSRGGRRIDNGLGGY